MTEAEYDRQRAGLMEAIAARMDVLVMLSHYDQVAIEATEQVRAIMPWLTMPNLRAVARCVYAPFTKETR